MYDETTRGALIPRMIGAAKLDVATYDEVEHDRGATGQAAAVVAMVAVASAVGGAGAGAGGIIGGLISAFFGWFVWSAVTYVIGDKLLGGTATWGELLRTIGFAQAPGVLYVFAALPGGFLIRFFVAVWILLAGIVAIREALDFSTGKAILTAVLGWFVMVFIMAILLAPAALVG